MKKKRTRQRTWPSDPFVNAWNRAYKLRGLWHTSRDIEPTLVRELDAAVDQVCNLLVRAMDESIERDRARKHEPWLRAQLGTLAAPRESGR